MRNKKEICDGAAVNRFNELPKRCRESLKGMETTADKIDMIVELMESICDEADPFEISNGYPFAKSLDELVCDVRAWGEAQERKR